MNLEDLVEAHLAGQQVEAPEHLRTDFERAAAGFAALELALEDTLSPEFCRRDRQPPALPADYEIVRELGRGGMGVVYLVQQKSLSRRLAVKVLRPGEAVFGRIVQRFLEEARHLARLRHENIVSVHEVGRAGDEPYFTMDYVDGEPLSAVLARRRLSPSEALTIWKQAAAGVQHAHSQGIIHRDLKPGNILLDAAGRAYVTDFGLARDTTQASALTQTGEVLGTPAYMAPEQALGETDRIGEVTDVYALGVILYEMLTGVPPFGRDAPANVLVRLLKEDPVPPRRVDRRIPRDLETICLKAISREPEHRYATVKAFGEDVRRFEAGEMVQARRPGIVYRTARFLRRHARLTVVATLTAAVVACLMFFLASPETSQLVSLGDSQHALGNHREAILLYQQAVRKAWFTDRLMILERIVRCSQEIGDSQSGVEAAMAMLPIDPDATFDKYDFEVARAVLARKLSISANPPFESVQNYSTAQLAERRLRIFLDGPFGSPQERKTAEQLLVEVCAEQGRGIEEEAGFAGWQPSGKPLEELQQQADDDTQPLTLRAQAAYGTAKHFEKAGDRTRALASYRRAFEFQRLAHPVCFGSTGGIESARPRSLHWETQEPRVLRQLARIIRRLDPQGLELLRGGLRFRLTGIDLPPELGMKLAVSLAGFETGDSADPGRRTEIIQGREVAATLGEIPVKLDQSAWLGVADGKYRLALKVGSRSSMAVGYAGARSSQMFQLLELDFSELPEVVEVRGAPVDLPAIRAYLAEPLDALEPAEDAAIAPAKTLYRWKPIPDASYYLFSLSTSETNAGGGTYFTSVLTNVKAEKSELHAESLPAGMAAKLTALPRGQTGVWNVTAYDAKHRVIGRTPQSRRFVVGAVEDHY